LRKLAAFTGVGFYRIAQRAEAAGGGGVGLHAGATAVLVRKGRADFTLGTRTMLLPDIGDSRIWVVPVTAGVRVH
jgi:hypothetical protein